MYILYQHIKCCSVCAAQLFETEPVDPMTVEPPKCVLSWPRLVILWGTVAVTVWVVLFAR